MHQQLSNITELVPSKQSDASYLRARPSGFVDQPRPCGPIARRAATSTAPEFFWSECKKRRF